MLGRGDCDTVGKHAGSVSITVMFYLFKCLLGRKGIIRVLRVSLSLSSLFRVGWLPKIFLFMVLFVHISCGNPNISMAGWCLLLC